MVVYRKQLKSDEICDTIRYSFRKDILMFLQILKKSFYRASIGYTVASIFYLVIMLDLYLTSANPYPLTLLRLFPFCFLIAFANALVTDIKKKGAWKLPVHFAILTLDIILFIWAPSKDTLSSGTTLILFVLYLVLYAVGALTVRHITKKKQTNTEYQSVYTKNNGK